MKKSKEAENEFILIKNSKIHSKGIFAKKDIKKGQKVIEYIGEKISKKESELRAEKYLQANKKTKSHGAVYIFNLNKRFDLDGNVSWNPARLINHSCDPNCETIDHNGHIWITTLRPVKKGEEITYNYGYDLENYKEHPCKCGSPNCVGYIVEKKSWKKLKKLLENKN